MKTTQTAEPIVIDVDPVKLTDLTEITRGADRMRTRVMLKRIGKPEFEWLRFGETHLDTANGFGIRILKGYLPEGVTDFEHDSAYVLQLPLIAVEFQYVWYHTTYLKAVVAPQDPASFRVPRPGYNPMTLPDTHKCPTHRGKNSHLIVPEGYYAGPPFDRTLWKHVAGQMVEIQISTRDLKMEAEIEAHERTKRVTSRKSK